MLSLTILSSIFDSFFFLSLSISIAFRRPHKESVSTSEGPDANGLFTEKASLSIILTRKEMGATFECRIESEALESTVRHHLQVDLQGMADLYNEKSHANIMQIKLIFFFSRFVSQCGPRKSKWAAFDSIRFKGAPSHYCVRYGMQT